MRAGWWTISTSCFNEAEANWPRNPFFPQRALLSSPGFNEAEANWPRNLYGWRCPVQVYNELQ